VKPRPDVVDLAVRRGDQERLVHRCNHASAEQRRLGDDGERRVHLITVDSEIAVGGSGDDAVLRTAIQAAPQMISGEAGLDALFDADAIRREGHGIACVAGERVDIGIGRRDAVGFGNCVHPPSIG